MKTTKERKRLSALLTKASKIKKEKKAKGFTLVELIVVIAIIGVLAVVLVPNMLSYIDKAKQATANDNAKKIYDSITYTMLECEAQTLTSIEQSAYDALTKKGTEGMMNASNPLDYKANFADHMFFDLNTDIGGYINAYFKDGELVAVAWSEDSDSESDPLIGRYPDPINIDQDITWENWYTPAS